MLALNGVLFKRNQLTYGRTGFRFHTFHASGNLRHGGGGGGGVDPVYTFAAILAILLTHDTFHGVSISSLLMAIGPIFWQFRLYFLQIHYISADPC